METPHKKSGSHRSSEAAHKESASETLSVALLHLLNQPAGVEEMAASLGVADQPNARAELEAVLARRAQLGGVFKSVSDLDAVLPAARKREFLVGLGRLHAQASAAVEVERKQFKTLLLQNPNYFGNLEVSQFTPVFPLQGNTSYEELVCLGLNPPYDRLEAVIHVKKTVGYGGDICAPGTREYVRFYVDLHDNGVWHDVGVSSVSVHDIPV
jgi:hypothetical protein